MPRLKSQGRVSQPQQPVLCGRLEAAPARETAPAETELTAMKNPSAPKKPNREWRITLIRKKGQYLARVEAPDAESAIKRAVEEFQVDEAHRARLIAEPIE